MLLAATLWFGTSCEEAPAQETFGRTLDSMLIGYPYIKKTANKIENDSLGANLGAFYEKLYELKTGKRDRVTIVHIGDSHIQADFLTGRMRQNLQLEFGNAGRGTVFPYRIAKTNGPSDYRSWTNGEWDARRGIIPDTSLPMGLSGFTIRMNDTTTMLRLLMKGMPELDYSFNKITLFHEKGMGAYRISVCDTFNCQLASIDPRAGSDFYSVATLTQPTDGVLFQFDALDSLSKSALIYGMVLENGKPGLLYNMIGINGAEYRHYNKAEKFMDQLKVLKPDLIIVSMGTNEGYAPAFRKAELEANMELLLGNMKKEIPDAQLLVTTPGDSFKRTRKGRVRNPNMLEARNTVIRECKKNNIAYWDLFAVMGGYGSMAKWYVSGLAAKDRLHFSKKGYDIQGRLLHSALMKDYEQYILLKYGKKDKGK